ncbi:MAG: hypothetical protein LBP89_06405 [Helicobacteraceae bacterium]|jgi:hypothetical protein|nr:hypothetical protein [Helicobacteraceae bacterium]
MIPEMKLLALIAVLFFFVYFALCSPNMVIKYGRPTKNGRSEYDRRHRSI